MFLQCIFPQKTENKVIKNGFQDSPSLKALKSSQNEDEINVAQKY